jgi:hypothetical protein
LEATATGTPFRICGIFSSAHRASVKLALMEYKHFHK